MDSSDLKTTVKNISSNTLTFSFLGPHGIKLAPGATYQAYGTVTSWLAAHVNNPASTKALENALFGANPTLVVIKTPAVLVYDSSAAAALANPSVTATGAPTGGGASGGSLAAGTYKVAYTFVNSWGETTIGTSTSATITVGATNIPRITVPSLPAGATSINLYVTSTGGAAPATLRQYATGITTTTYDMSAALPALGNAHPAPPTTNTTAAATVRKLTVANNTLGTADPSMGRYTG